MAVLSIRAATKRERRTAGGLRGRIDGRTPRRLSPLVNLKMRRKPPRGAGFWNCSAARDRSSSHGRLGTCGRGKAPTRLTPPLFACRPPMRGDGHEFNRAGAAGDKSRVSERPMSEQTKGRRGHRHREIDAAHGDCQTGAGARFRQRAPAPQGRSTVPLPRRRPPRPRRRFPDRNSPFRPQADLRDG